MTTENILTQEEGGEIEWLRGYRNSSKISVTELAKNIGYSATVTRRALNGNYTADMQSFCAKVREFRATIQARALTGQEVGFVHTQVALDVIAAANAARVDKKVIMVRGVSQIGKSTAIKEYAEANSASVVLVRMPTNPTACKLGSRLCAAVGCSNPRGDEDAMQALKKRITPNMLVIVDEFHQAFYAGVRGVRGAVEWLRELKDETDCGLLLALTELPDVDLSGSRVKGMLEQLNQRGQTVRLASTPSKKDVRLIAEHYGLGEPSNDVWAIITKLGRENAFGKLMYRFKLAQRSAKANECTLTWDYFIAEHLRLNNLEQ
ncbi:MAG: AAA family ATPase [Akkermansia sp.]